MHRGHNSLALACRAPCHGWGALHADQTTWALPPRSTPAGFDDANYFASLPVVLRGEIVGKLAGPVLRASILFKGLRRDVRGVGDWGGETPPEVDGLA